MDLRLKINTKLQILCISCITTFTLSCGSPIQKQLESPVSKKEIVEKKYPDGKISEKYEVLDGKREGYYTSYYADGKTRFETNYMNGQINGLSKLYTPNGELAKEEIWDSGSAIDRKIFWQMVPGEQDSFLFVSQEGFYTRKDQKEINLTETTPDNIIEQKTVNGEFKTYIWKKGKPEKIEVKQNTTTRTFKTGK